MRLKRGGGNEILNLSLSLSLNNLLLDVTLIYTEKLLKYFFLNINLIHCF